jgi:hypothetical protein
MTRKTKDPLVGKYFHSVKADKEMIEWQGLITARVDTANGVAYLLQLYEWIVGCESNQVLMPAADMMYWLIYDSLEEMNGHYKEYSHRCEARRRQAEVA